jgi:hypothetical protein
MRVGKSTWDFPSVGDLDLAPIPFNICGNHFIGKTECVEPRTELASSQT